MCSFPSKHVFISLSCQSYRRKHRAVSVLSPHSLCVRKRLSPQQVTQALRCVFIVTRLSTFMNLAMVCGKESLDEWDRPEIPQI